MNDQQNGFDDFPIAFSNEADFDQKPNSTYEDLLFGEAETRLRGLGEGNQDITGANVHFDQPVRGRATTYLYEATVTVYMRPTDISVAKRHEDPKAALKAALDVVEREVREQRRRLREQQRAARPDDMA